MTRKRRISRRTRLQLVTIALLVVVIVAVLAVRACGDDGAVSEIPSAAPPVAAVTGTAPTGAGTPQDSAPADAPERTQVTLIGVVDGDTIWVRLPDGSEEKVRYIGIDAPEIPHEDSPGERLGEEATAHNAELLAAGPLSLHTDVEERDDFGRLLAYVYAGDVLVNERMVFDGYAWAHNYPPNLSLQDRLWAAHDAARAAQRGVWAPEEADTQ